MASVQIADADVFTRAKPGFNRLVVIGHSGLVSLEAFRWLYDIGIAVVQIDNDGELVLAAGPSGLDDARLRRAQAVAASNGIGLEISKDLINQKLAGQAEALRLVPPLRRMPTNHAPVSRIAEGSPVNTDPLERASLWNRVVF